MQGVSSQKECQQKCIAKNGCVGISYSHKDKSNSEWCYLCLDDRLNRAPKGIGFYRRPGIVELWLSINISFIQKDLTLAFQYKNHIYLSYFIDWDNI